MPLYDYICSKCNNKFETIVSSRAELVVCEKCGSVADRQFPTSFNLLPFPEDGLFLEHVSPEGKLFRSRSELRAYANEHNLELGALL